MTATKHTSPEYSRMVLEFLRELARQISQEIHPPGRSDLLFDPWAWREPAFGTSVYLVSLSRFEQQISLTTSSTPIFLWLQRCQREVLLPNRYVGVTATKPDHAQLSLNLSVRGEPQARRLARCDGQATIYHPASRSRLRVAALAGAREAVATLRRVH